MKFYSSTVFNRLKKRGSNRTAKRARPSLHILAAAIAVLMSTLLRNTYSADIIISGYMVDPHAADSRNEYLQLVATKAIDFSMTNYSVVAATNGNAPINGWIAGTMITYGFNLTSGTVSAGETFYVGGSNKRINGNGSPLIAEAKWIRSIDTAVTPGDGFGNTSSFEVMGNGEASADGFAVFSGLTTSLSASSVPLDAIFYGHTIGNAVGAEGGYMLPNNDRYQTSQGTFGHGTNTYLYGVPVSGTFTRLTGTYNVGTNSWGTARTAANIASPMNLTDIASTITLLAGPANLVWATGSENWNTSSPNWTNGVPTPSLYKEADHVIFNNSSNGGTITIQAGGVSPTSTAINNDESHPYTFQNSAGDTNGIKTGSLTKSGAGALTLMSPNTYSGDTNILGGTLNIVGAHTTGANYSVASGANLITNNVRASNSLTVNGTATINTNGGAAGVSKVEALTIGSGGKLNLKDNDLVVGTAADVMAVRAAIKTGVAGAAGITSDLPAFGVSTGFGYALGIDTAISPSLAGLLSGQSYDTNSVLVKYTYLGDADLDGDSDLNDLGLWASAFTGDLGNPVTPATFWTSGDFDYDGDTDLNDLGLWSSTFTGDLGGGAGSLIVVAPGASAGAISALNGMGITVVPEPSTWILVSLGVLGSAIATHQTRRSEK